MNSRPMRLAILVTEYPKTTETFILRDIMTFLGAGAEVRLYHLKSYNSGEILHDFALPTRALASHPKYWGARAFGTVLRHPGVTLKSMGQIVVRQAPEPVLMAKSLGLVLSAAAIADELRDWGADHIHAEFAGHPATAAWVLNRLTGIPYSVSCRAHDIFRTQRLLAEKLGAASFVRTVSRFGKRFLLDHVPGLDRARMHVIHSSVDIAGIPRLPPAPNDPFHILYVGSLHSRKGVDILLNALTRLPFDNWCCSVAGDGPERDALHALAASLNLTGKVTFLGKQDFQSVSRLYKSAGVVAVPSVIGPKGRTEGIPNVAIEAMAFQRPVISTAVSGIPELIEDRVTGRLIAPGSVGELVAAMGDIHADPQGARAMAERGRAFVEAEFNLQTNALRQLDLFGANRRGA